MRTCLLPLAAALALAGCATPQPPLVKLEKANVLPLALDDNYSFGKRQITYLGPEQQAPAQSEPAAFERRRMLWGAVDESERAERWGTYYSFFWKSRVTSDVTVRFEYRQPALGNYVMAMEKTYPAARGTYRTDFQVTGDDFAEFGRVTAWRALLVVEGRVVALTQSFIWK
ncbi:MAG: hypothetical protein N2322_05605 [Terrimicrobiaceae bacterium]|nr:hypothetical protein [Terrimicrobiaceae bacterium]